ncbi:MAG TPA: MBL fold metallo-hydrolase [Flavobacterium sp.]|nr:MBL fold metallo-hydrolase [Flavobacterium sp.]
MTLTWYGLSSFKITAAGDGATVVTDPFAKDSGLTPPRGGADIVLISRDEPGFNNTDGITGEPLVIRNPGEFDYKGIAIRGINHKGATVPGTIYQLEVDGINICFIGALEIPELSEEQVEELGTIDVLVVPVGGKDIVCNAENATRIVQQLEPKYVVPSFYAQKGLSMTLDSEEKFLKEMAGQAQTEDRLTLKAKDLTGETVQVVVLNSQR